MIRDTLKGFLLTRTLAPSSSAMTPPNFLSTDGSAAAPEGLVRAPCPACGAQMQYSAERKALACTHCGTTQELVLTKNGLHENALAPELGGPTSRATGHLPDVVANLLGSLTGLSGLAVPVAALVGRFGADAKADAQAAPTTPPDGVATEEKRLFSCRSCGAQTSAGYDALTLTCAFCGSKDINPDAQKTRLIVPAGVLPFQLPKPEATASFKKWVGSRWLAPNDLGAGATLDNLRGVYVPFWTFDAQAHSKWSGEAGRHVGAGSKRRTDWTRRSGSHDHFYDDHLETASRFLLAPGHEAMCREVASYALQDTVDYDPRLLLGWEAEVYGVDLPEAATRARHALEAQEREACSRELGGDTQRNVEVETTLTNLTYKHLLLPLWLCAYVYKGNVYHFLVNGQSGRISGRHPYSPWKIAGLVLLAIMALLAWAWLKSKQ